MKKIQRQVGIECMTSRIPGLFAYIDYSETGGTVLRKATESSDGCYGKVVEAIMCPCQLTVDGEDIILRAHIYNYSELMSAYYTYKDITPAKHPFMKMMRDAIGEVHPRDTGKFTEEEDLVPETLYLSNARTLLKEMDALKKACDMMDTLAEMGEEDTEICCRCEKYKRMGGQKMQELLAELIEKGENTANSMYNLARYGKGRLSLNIPLTLTKKEIGHYGLAEKDFKEGEEQIEETTAIQYCSVKDTSRLTSLRGEATSDAYGNPATPGADEDFLGYYTVGKIRNAQYERDEDGNITGCVGDQIQSIKVDEGTRTLTFEYVIGARFTFEYDQSGVITTEGPFGGLYFTESYTYEENSDIDMIVSVPGLFTKLINGNYVNRYIGEEPNKTYYANGLCFPFKLYGTTNDVERDIGWQKGNTTYVMSEYSTEVKHTYDVINTRTGYEKYETNALYKDDSLSNLLYAPNVRGDIFIKRGNNSAFDRHIRLSEIKTLDDLDTYENGAYYKIENLS